MTQKEAAQILAILKAAYPQFYKDMTKKDAIGTVNVWAVQFAKMPADIVLLAVNKCISTSSFPPSPSEVKKKFQSLYWEACEELNTHRTRPHLSKEQIKYFEYIKEKTTGSRYQSYEPSIFELTFENNNQLLLGGVQE